MPFVFLIQITGWLVLIEVEARLYAQKPPLEQIRELILYANYPEAISQARLLLERNDLDARTRNQLLELLAIAQIADRDMQAARETLELLYRRDPGHVLSDPDASPPVIAAFAQAREAQKKPISVRLIHRPPRIQNREAIPIEVRFREGGDAV
ncbi:MAG: hypothetical protein N2515_09705, partial [Deltaproteobacteria bacterium]|nr:hypothetical protein [Deltaproteobacteria bacterium]